MDTFGLVIYFKQQLVTHVNKSSLFLTFDESLNQRMKMKPPDLDVGTQFTEQLQTLSERNQH